MDLVSLLALVLSVVFVTISAYVIVLHRMYRFAKAIPYAGFSKYPLITDWKHLRKTHEEMFAQNVKNFLQNDRMFKLWIGPCLLFGISHPDLIRTLLTHPECVEKPFVYKFLRSDRGLLPAIATIWRRQRKHLNPTFNLKILHSFVPIFEKCCESLVKDLKRYENGQQAFDILPFTNNCTLKMILQTSLGVTSVEGFEYENLTKHLKRSFSLPTKRMSKPHLYWEPIYRMTHSYSKEIESKKYCEAVASKIINSKRKTMEFGNINSLELDEPKRPRIFVDQLLQMGDLFDEEEIIQNSFIFIFGGSDTSGILVAYACLFLGMFPHVQQKVYSEIAEQIPPDQTEPIMPEQLKALSYTEQVLNECLRLCPIAPTIGRTNLVPIELDGITVPAGNIFMFSFFALHRRQDFWGSDADQFDPDRFSPERSAGRHPFAFLPFSGGPRNCIGWRYAMMSMKLLLVYLLREYKFGTDIKFSELRFEFDTTLTLAFEHLVKIESRNANGISK